eukprot:gene24178-9767_t
MGVAGVIKKVSKYGRNGCLTRIFQLNVVDPDNPSTVLAKLRVKPQQVHINARTLSLENVMFIYCPQNRMLKVDVPIKLVNTDQSPGVRKGGWISMERRTVQYHCLGSHVPPFIELDVAAMELETKLLVKDMPVPNGTRIAGNIFDSTVARIIPIDGASSVGGVDTCALFTNWALYHPH